MAQISYGTITINDITDINDVYLEYALALSGANVTNNYTFDNLGEISWSTTYPTWQSGYQIWIREVQEKEGIQQKEYKTPYLDTAVNQINNNYIGLDNKLKTFFYPGDSNYAGAFAVGHVDNLNVNNINTYGFNTRIQVGAISMGYNAIPLLEMGLLGNNFNGIKLYSPILSNQNIITGNRLDATLTSEGLKLIKGGIVAGSYDSIASDENQDFVYLSSENYGVGTKIGDSASDKADWRQIIGNKFGVDKAGNLYAAGAHINGDIIAQSLTIGSGANAYSGIAAINITGYSIEIEVADIAGSTETKKLIPHLLHNGENADSEVTDKTDFIWYVDNSTSGIQGDSVDGSIVGTYGSSYRVIYDFDDGAVEGGTTTRTLTVDPTKYITKISDTGITIHPEMLTEQSSWVQLDGNGMELFNSSNESIAKYGSEIRIGKIDESHIFQDFNSWHMVDKEGQTYVNIEDMRDSYGYADIVDTFIGRGDQSKYTTSLVISRGTPGHKISDPILTINNVQQDYTDDIDIYTRSYMTIIRLFTHTTDTEIDSDKDYYIRTKLQSIFNAFEMVNTPIASDLSTYYELCPLADGDILVASYKTDSSQAKAFTFGTRKSQSNIGAYSFINGFDCTASGNNSSAEGNETTASGSNSHAEGYNTTASGSNSHAEGYNTTASGLASHAEGYHTTASNTNSHAEGVGATASGYNSHAEGYSTTASGYESHAEGRETIASNSRSHAEGYRTTASNTNSHAEGDETTASGSNSHAEGYNTTASGISSHAEGDRTTASGDISHAEGSLTIAEGDGSHAEGIYTRAFGDYSHAQNCGTTASQDSQTAIGKYNSNNSNTAFEIGNGTDDTHRSNAFTVDWNGNVVSSGNITDGSGNILSNKVNISELNSINTRVTTVESGIFALDVDASASASTDATSGEDMDLFNNIRTLGWYSDIIV